MSEVLRHQIQEEQCWDIAHGRHLSPAEPITKSDLATPGARHVHLRVHEIELSVPELRPWDRTVYLKLSIGQRYTSRTPKVPATPSRISFKRLDLAATLDEERLLHEQLLLECFAEREVSEPTLLCDFRLQFAQAIQLEHVNQRVALVGSGSSSLYGEFSVRCVVSADDEEHIRRSDEATQRSIVRQRQQAELSAGSSMPKPQPVMLQQQIRLNELVAELRGDSSFFLKALTAQLQSSDITTTGCATSDLVARVNKFSVLSSMLIPCPQRLPPFHTISSYLLTKDRAHSAEIKEWANLIQSTSASVSEITTSASGSVSSSISSLLEREGKYQGAVAALRDQLRELEARVTKLKRILPAPREPVFPPLSEVLLVPALDPANRLNAKGRTKKKLRTFMVEDVVKAITSGQHDGRELAFKDLWPDPGQEEVINTAIERRNATVLAERARAEEARREAERRYLADLAAWELAEAQRLESLKECRRSARLVNLSIDANTERISIIEEELRDLREHLLALEESAKLEEEFRGRFASLRAKHELERRRIFHSVGKLKSRLVYILAARRSALLMPSNCHNSIDFEYAARKAEGMLRMLRFELVRYF